MREGRKRAWQEQDLLETSIGRSRSLCRTSGRNLLLGDWCHQLETLGTSPMERPVIFFSFRGVLEITLWLVRFPLGQLGLYSTVLGRNNEREYCRAIIKWIGSLCSCLRQDRQQYKRWRSKDRWSFWRFLLSLHIVITTCRSWKPRLCAFIPLDLKARFGRRRTSVKFKSLWKNTWAHSNYVCVWIPAVRHMRWATSSKPPMDSTWQ